MRVLSVGTTGGRLRPAAFLFVVTAALSMLISTPADARKRVKRKPQASSQAYAPPYAAIVVDAKTGRVLHAENEDALRYPASITKVMTLYLMFEQLERGRFTPDTMLPVSARAAAQAPSKIGLRAGASISVDDAIKSLVTKSANDMAVVVAEAIGGTVENFAVMMTRKARSLGMERTVFRNASGLPDKEQVTTASDLAILARAIQDRFPRYYSYFQTRRFDFAGRSYNNHNKLLGRVDGVDGIKTGFTRLSGFNLMTSARTGDRHIVAIVLGGRSGNSRDQIMANLVERNMPRAYAGARTAPLVAEAPLAARPAVVAAAVTNNATPGSASQVSTATIPQPVARAPEAPAPVALSVEPLQISALRPVAASVAPAPSPAPAMRWQAGPQAVAPVPDEKRVEKAVNGKTEGRLDAWSGPSGPVASALAARTEDRADLRTASIRPAPEKLLKSAPSAWVIQVGATTAADQAKDILDAAQNKAGRVLAKAEPFTEKFVHKGETFYRARFSGFAEADAARAACNALKRNGVSCFATRS